MLNFFGLPVDLHLGRPHRRVADAWLDAVGGARFNPVNWGVVASREMSGLDTNWSRVALYLGLLLAFVAAASALATRAFGVYRRTL